MLVAEDLIDDYINGNLSKVKEALETAPPLIAATVAVDLYRFLRCSGNAEAVGVFVDTLRAWQP